MTDPLTGQPNATPVDAPDAADVVPDAMPPAPSARDQLQFAPDGTAVPRSTYVNPQGALISTLSFTAAIAGFVGGIIAFVPFIGAWLALPFPIAAIVLGLIARRREPNANKWFWSLGVVIGFAGLVVPVAVLVFTAILWGLYDANGTGA